MNYLKLKLLLRIYILFIYHSFNKKKQYFLKINFSKLDNLLMKLITNEVDYLTVNIVYRIHTIILINKC